MIRIGVILIASVLSVSGCDSHRTESFCELACECNDNSECVQLCVSDIRDWEELAGESVISDDCYLCVEQTSCSIIPYVCSDECSGLIENAPQPDDTPQPTSVQEIQQ